MEREQWEEHYERQYGELERDGRGGGREMREDSEEGTSLGVIGSTAWGNWEARVGLRTTPQTDSPPFNTNSPTWGGEGGVHMEGGGVNMIELEELIGLEISDTPVVQEEELHFLDL